MQNHLQNCSMGLIISLLLCTDKTLKPSYDLKINFFQSLSPFFLKAWEGILQYIVLLLGMILVLYLTSVVLIVKWLLSFLCWVLFGARLYRVPAKLFH